MPRATRLHSVVRAGASEAVVVACALTPQQRARLSQALGPRFDLHTVGTFDQLIELLGAMEQHVGVVVVPAQAGSGQSLSAIVRLVVRDQPQTAVVAYCQPGARHSNEIRSLAVAGVHEFVFEGVDDVGVTFEAIIRAAQRQCAAEVVLRQLSTIVPQQLHRIAEAILTNPERVTSIQALANELGLHRKTVFNQCIAAKFLTPAELLAWLRLALVGYLLESTSHTVERIALELNYPSVTALRNGIRRYTRFNATHIRATGGLKTVTDALQHRIRTGHGEKLHLV